MEIFNPKQIYYSQESICPNSFTKKLKETPKGGTFKLGGKTYKDNSELEEKECMECESKSKYPVVEKWEGDVEIEHTGEHSEKTIEQINSEIKKLKTKSEAYKNKGQKVPQTIRKKMSELYFAKRAKQGWKGKGKAAVKESIQLTEDQMIDLIESIVMEQKENDGKNPVKMDNNLKGQPKPPGMSNYERAVKGSKNENEKYYKEVTKKMKEYLKDGSKGDYEMNPKHFPAGNGELGEMKKKAYKASGAVQDYIDNFTAAGQENIMYDEINPNEEWMDKNIEGSSMTGNNPEWANAVETPNNKKRNNKNNLTWLSQ